LTEKYFDSHDDAMAAIPVKRTSINIFSTLDLSKENKRGICDGVNVQMDINAPLRTAIHEIGHALGIGDGLTGVMVSGGDSSEIYEEHIMSCLNRVGIISRSEDNCPVPNSKYDALSPNQYKIKGVFNNN
jgi:hypothetical protein